MYIKKTMNNSLNENKKKISQESIIKLEKIMICLFFINVPVSIFTSLTILGDLSKYYVLILSICESIRIVKYRIRFSNNSVWIIIVILIFIINALFYPNKNELSNSINYIYIFYIILLFSNLHFEKSYIDKLIKITYISVCIYIIVLFITILFTTNFDRINFYILNQQIHPNYQTVILNFQPALLSYLILKQNISSKYSIITNLVILSMNIYIILKMETRAQFLITTGIIIIIIVLYFYDNFNCKGIEDYIKKFKRIIKENKLVLLILLLISFFVIMNLDNRVFNLSKMFQDGGSNRLILWKEAFNLSITNHNYFGIGTNVFLNNSTLHVVPHNSYIRLLLDTGFLGLFSYLIFIGNKFKMMKNNDIAFYGILFSVIFTPFFVDTFDSLTYIFQLLILIIVLNGISGEKV